MACAAGAALDVYIHGLYLLALVMPPGGDSWQAAQHALRWPHLHLALQINVFANPEIDSDWRLRVSERMEATLVAELDNWSPDACLAALSLMAAGVAQLTGGQQQQEQEGQQQQQGQQQLRAAADPGSAVATLAQFAARAAGSRWSLLSKAAMVGLSRSGRLADHAGEHEGQGRSQQQALALAEATHLAGLQLHTGVIRAGLQELGAAAEAAAAAGRQAELAGDDARWISLLWTPIMQLFCDVGRACVGDVAMGHPEERQHRHQWWRRRRQQRQQAPIAISPEAIWALGRAWQQLPLAKGAALAEALARLLCKAQHAKPLLRLAERSQGASPHPRGSVEAACGYTLVNNLLVCMSLWCTQPDSRPAPPLTAAGAAAACGLLQTCCKLVQRTAQLRSQGTPPAELLFAASWSEAGSLLGSVLGSAVSIGAQWLFTDQSKVLHTSAAMAAAPRRWVGVGVAARVSCFPQTLACGAPHMHVHPSTAVATYLYCQLCCHAGACSWPQRLSAASQGKPHACPMACPSLACLPPMPACLLQPVRCYGAGAGVCGACAGRVAVP